MFRKRKTAPEASTHNDVSGENTFISPEINKSLSMFVPWEQTFYAEHDAV